MTTGLTASAITLVDPMATMTKQPAMMIVSSPASTSVLQKSGDAGQLTKTDMANLDKFAGRAFELAALLESDASARDSIPPHPVPLPRTTGGEGNGNREVIVHTPP